VTQCCAHDKASFNTRLKIRTALGVAVPWNLSASPSFTPCQAGAHDRTLKFHLRTSGSSKKTKKQKLILQTPKSRY